MIRKITSGLLITSVLIVGMVAQAGAYLLAFASPAMAPEVEADAFLPFSEAGPFAVGVRRLDRDEAPVPVTAWYPALQRSGNDSFQGYSYAINMFGPDNATALATYSGQAWPEASDHRSGGPYPLVVLSHGFAITPGSYAWLAEHLASYGMVVVAPQHHESLDPSVLWRSTVERPGDIRAVLTSVDEAVGPGGQLEGLIDSETVAVMGHSYGGYTALAAAGARLDTDAFTAICDSAYTIEDPLTFLCDALLPRLGDMADLAGLDSVPSGLWPAWSDPRVDAVVAIAGDAAMFGESGLTEVNVPLMAIGGMADTDSPFEWGTRLSYDGVSSVRKVEVALEGAAHMIFAGECASARRLLSLVSLGFCSDPAWDRTRAHDLVKHEVTAFLLVELAADDVAAAALVPGAQDVPQVRYRAEGYR